MNNLTNILHQHHTEQLERVEEQISSLTNLKSPPSTATILPQTNCESHQQQSRSQPHQSRIRATVQIHALKGPQVHTNTRPNMSENNCQFIQTIQTIYVHTLPFHKFIQRSLQSIQNHQQMETTSAR